MNWNKDVSMKLFTSQLPVSPPRIRAWCRGIRNCGSQFQLSRGAPDMGKRLVLPALALLAALCLPGISREASAQVPDVLWEATLTLKNIETLGGARSWDVLGCDGFSSTQSVRCSTSGVLSHNGSAAHTFTYDSRTYTIKRFRYQGSNQRVPRYLDFWLAAAPALPAALTSALKLCIGHVGYSFSDRDTRTSGRDPASDIRYDGRTGHRYRWTAFSPTSHFFDGGPSASDGSPIGTPSSAWGAEGTTVKVGLAKDCGSIAPPPPVTNLSVVGGVRKFQATWSDPADSNATSYEVHFTGNTLQTLDNDLGKNADGSTPATLNALSHWVASDSGAGAVTARTTLISGWYDPSDSSTTALTDSADYRVRVRAGTTGGKSAWTEASVSLKAADAAQSDDATLSALKVEWSSSADGTYSNLPLEEVPVAPDDSDTDERYVAATVGTHVKITATGKPLQQIEWKLANDPSGMFVALVSAVPSAAIELPSGDFYQFSVKVTAEDGTVGNYLVELSKEGTENEPHPPRNLSVEPVSATSLLLNWGLRPIVGASGDATVAPSGYEVHYTTSSTAGNTDVRTDNDASMGWVAATHSGTSTSLALSSLASSTKHWVRVRSVKSYTDAMNDPQTETSHWVFGEGTTGDPARTVQFQNTEQVCVESIVLDNTACPALTVQVSPALAYASAAEIRLVSAESSFDEVDAAGFQILSCATYFRLRPWLCRLPQLQQINLSGGKYDIPLTTEATGVNLNMTTRRLEEQNDPSLREISELAVFELSRVSGAPYVIGANSKIKVRVLDNTLTTSFNPIENLTLATTSDSVTATWDGVGTITNFDVHYTSAAPSAVGNDAAASGNDASAGWVAVDHTFSSRDGAAETISGLGTDTNYRVRVRAIYQEYYNDPDRAWDDWAHAEARTLPTVSLSVSPNPVTEGSDATVEVTLSTTLAADVTIPLTYTNDQTNPPDQGDYTAPANLTVTAGNTSASGTISAAQDTDAEDEAFSVALGTLPNTVVAGSASSVDFKILDDDKPPLVPDTLAVIRGNGQVRLTWTQPADTRTEVAAVSGYDVHYTSETDTSVVADDAAASGSDASAGWVDAGHSGTDLTHTITGLVNDTAYRVRLRASNGKGNSGWVLGSGTPTDLPTVSLSVSPNSVVEGNSVTVTVTLSNFLTNASSVQIPATIGLTLTDGTAEGDDHGTLASLEIPAGQKTATGTITTAHDDADIEDETFTVALGALTPAGELAEGSPASIEVTIVDDDKPPLAPDALNVSGLNGRLELTWNQPQDSRTEVVAVSGYEVHYTSALVGSVADDAAASGNDASAAWVDAGHSGTDAMHTISTLANGTAYRVRVRADNGKAEKSAWTHGTGTPVPPTVSLSVSPARVNEGSSVTVTVRLTEALKDAQDMPTAATIALALTNGTAEDGDYGTLASIEIAAGELSASGTISAEHDADGEDETFTVALGTPLPSPAVADASASSALVTIVDDDKRPAAPSGLVITLGTGQLSLSWRQSAVNRAQTTAIRGYDVHYTSNASVGRNARARGSDASAGWVDAGHRGTEPEHVITGLESNTLYRVRIRADNGRGKSGWLHERGTTPEPPTVSLSVEPLKVDEGESVTVTVTLTKGLAADAVIPLEMANGTAEDDDYGTLASITIAAGELSASGAISAEHDADAEDETFTVALGTMLPSPAVADASASSVQVTIVDDDKRPLAPTGLAVAPGYGQLALGWQQPAEDRAEVAPVSGYDVHYTTAAAQAVADDADALGEDASVSWVDAGHRGTELEHLISGLTGNTMYRVRVRADNGKGRSEWLHGQGTTPVSPTVSLSVEPPKVDEGDSVTVTVTLSKRLTADAAMPLELTNGTAEDGDYGTLASITIAAGELSASGTISAEHDADDEDETFTVALGATLPYSAVANASASSAQVTIVDDDKRPLAPTGLTVAPGFGQLALGWQQPAEDRAEVAAVSGYDVHYTSATAQAVADDADAVGEDASVSWADAGHRGTELEHLISGLTGNTLYRVRVRADNGKAKSEWLHGQGTTPVAPTVSLSVEPLKVDEGDSVTVTVTLSKGLTADAAMPLELTDGTAEDGDYGTLASITIASGELSASGAITALHDADDEDKTFTVALGATLPYSVVADASASSAQVTIVDDDKQPLAPTGLVVAPRNERLALGWQQPAEDRAEVAPVSGYDVHYTSATAQAVADDADAVGADASVSWADAGHRGTEPEHLISELVNHTLYRVRVRADNGKGKSGWLHGQGTPSRDAQEEAALKQSLEALAGTILGSAVSRIGERVESSGQSSQPLAGDADGSSSLLRTLSVLFGLPQPGAPGAGVNDVDHDRFQAHRAHRDEVASPAGRGPGAARYASGQLRLNAFSFSLDEPSAGASGSDGALVLWGRGDSHSFRGTDRGSFEDELGYSGSWSSVYLGIDQGFGPGRLAGVALSLGRGKVNYRYGEGEHHSGRYEARLRSVYPYFSAEVADGTRLWATFGYGRGEISNYRATEEEPGAGDLRLGLAAIGAKHELNEWPSVRLSLVGDAGHARLKVDSAVRPLEGLQSKVSRIRAGLEMSGRNFAAAAPYLRVSARFERGETLRRKGLEAEGGIRWSGVRHGAELHARALRLRGNLTSHRETGIGASVYYSPSPDGTGASLTLSHDWGRPRGSDTLWQNGSLSVTDSQSVADADSARSLNAELGYGMYSERLLGLVTPKLGWREDATGDRRLRIGAAYRANSWLTPQLGVEFGIHRRRTQSGVADYGGDLNASMSW